VGEASDGRTGVEGVGETQPDVVLLDLSMPDMDGLEAIPLMRERAPDSRLVVLSGHEAGRISLEALGQGATRYLNKAADFDAIRAEVREVAKLQPPFSDERFRIVHRMWTAYLSGAIDDVLKAARPDATWGPCLGGGHEVHTLEEARAIVEEWTTDGRFVDPRAYGVELHGGALMVKGTLKIRGSAGLTETEVFWVFCFKDSLVSLAATFDGREQALETIRERCAA
jgi:CheY-like chemotaxis protein